MASDIPDIPQSVDGAVRKPLSKLREAVQVLLGFRGEPEDAALTLRKMVQLGFANKVSTTPGGSVGYVPVGGTGGTGTGGSTEVDLTPPPNVPDFTASPGLTQIFVEWPAATYTQGNGHKQTNIYAVKKAAGDATLPTFSQATRVFSATGALTVASLPSDLSTRWHIWLKWETNDGVESSAPTGGTNGKVAQTGKIGNTDLGPLIVEAGNLANGSITPAKIVDASIDYQKIANGAIRVQHLLVAPTSLVVDPTFAQGSTGWVGFSARYPKTAPEVPDPSLLPVDHAAVFTGRDGQMKTRLKVEPGEQYKASILVHKNNGLPSTGLVVLFFDANGTYWAGHVGEINFNSPWFRVETSFTVPAGAVTMSVAPWNGQDHGGPIGSWFANLQVEKKNDASLIVDGSITATKMAANAIAVGTAAIQNGAIVNAMIGDATIDNAKIASLSVSKLVAGSLAVGQHITSTNYVADSSGWYIGANGFAEFSNVTIRGATYTGTVYAGAGTIGGINITAFSLYNTGFVSGVSGFALGSDGTVEFNQGATFRGALDVGGNSGQRTKITNAGVQVFNSGNVEVIALGIY